MIRMQKYIFFKFFVKIRLDNRNIVIKYYRLINLSVLPFYYVILCKIKLFIEI